MGVMCSKPVRLLAHKSLSKPNNLLKLAKKEYFTEMLEKRESNVAKCNFITHKERNIKELLRRA